MKKRNIFPYYISDQPKEKLRTNLLLISEDVEVGADDNNDEGIIDEDYPEPKKTETKYHYCWIKNPADYEDYPESKKKETKYHYCGIKNLDRLLFDQNKHKTKTYFCDRCLYGSPKKTCLSNTKKTAMASTKNQQE